MKVIRSKKSVEDIQPGEMINPRSCPTLKDHPLAKDEFSVSIVEIEDESATLISFYYQDYGCVQYPVGTILEVVRLI